MKMISLGLLLIFITIKISANENWIEIEPINKTQISKTKIDVNLSQIEPISKMIKNATAVKQLIGATTKKEIPVTNDKNWFILSTEDNQ